MRRYLPLFLLSFFILIVVLTGSTYLSGYAGKQTADSVTRMTAYTTMPVEEISVLAQEYEKKFHVHVNIVPLSTTELLAHLEEEQIKPQADIILADRVSLNQIKKAGFLATYTSEQVDMIPDRFKDVDNCWTGIWYDPMVFAVNLEFLRSLPHPPQTWDELTKNSKARLAMTDFLAADAAANLFYSLAITNGEEKNLEYLKQIHLQVVQYAKFLATPVRMAGMGECDIAIASQSEALRYLYDHFPIRIVYPQDGTSFILTGAGLVASAPHQDAAKDFLEWLIQDQVQIVLKENKFYFVPTNPLTQGYQEYAIKGVILFDKQEEFAPEQKRLMLDKWVQTVRFSAK